MMLPALVFVGVVAIVLGAYFLFVVRDEQEMLRRLQPEARARLGRRPGGGMLRPDETMSSVGAIDTLMRTSRFMGKIQTFLDQGAVRLSVSVFLLAIGCSFLLLFLLGTMVGKTPIAGAIMAPIGAAIPYLYVRGQRTKRVRKFEEQFPEAIDLVARALRAGHALPTGLGMVADELKAPVGTEFRILYDEQNFGLTLPDAMRNFARRVPVLDAKFFVTAVLTQRETGGNLAEVLDNLGAVIRDRFKVKRQVRVLSAHGRITGWVLAMLPPVLALATFVVNPNHLGLLVGDPLGRKMIIAAIVLQVSGTLIIRKLVDVEYSVTPQLLLTLLAVFAAVAVVTGSMMSGVLNLVGSGRRRLREAAQKPSTGVLIDAPTLAPEESAFVKRMATLLPRSPKDMTALRRRLGRAGYYAPGPIAAFTLAQLLSPVLFAGIALWFTPPGTQRWVLGGIAGLVGYQAPALWLYRKTVLRQKQIENGLPDLLDLLIVCLEAGSALDQAIIRASDELVLSYPALAEEFRMLVTETRAGKPRLEAFRNLASRTGVEDIRALVSMLVQTDRFGTSVSNALRTHADTSRTKRRQRAEERAAKLGVKLVFPLVFMLFPAFFVVTLGPAVIQFVRVFFGQMAGQ